MFLLSSSSVINWDAIIGIVSIIIALGALIITLRFNYLERRHKKLSVKPLINTSCSVLQDGKMGVYMSNNGFGPAKIKPFRFRFNGTLYPTIGELFKVEFPKALMNDQVTLTDVQVTNTSGAKIIGIQKTMPLYEANYMCKSELDKNELFYFTSQIEISFSYCNIYEEYTHVGYKKLND